MLVNRLLFSSSQSFLLMFWKVCEWNSLNIKFLFGHKTSNRFSFSNKAEDNIIHVEVQANDVESLLLERKTRS